MNIYVGNLSFQIKDNDLKEIFLPYGEVLKATVIKDRETKRSKGFGFVEMADENAKNAISELNSKEVFGRALRVNEAKPKE